jgi:hypothetical protein
VLPWPVWCSIVAVTSAVLGVQWDIAWHRSVGRDTFFSPPHIAIYLGGILAGVACGALILSTTFGKDEARRAAAVKIWGFRGPLGAFIAAWGGIAMIVSAPFDDWWHNAYGLDVKIISPPHTVLALGIFAIELGTLILVLGFLNRAEGEARARLERWFLYVATTLLVMQMTFLMEHTDRTNMHNASFYRDVALGSTAVLVAVRRASRHRWAATWLAGAYAITMLVLLWVFPLVSAEPKLGPVYHPVTHLIPAGFPLLLVAPALAIDLVSPRIDGWAAWRQTLVLGTISVLVLLCVQWPFALFLQSEWARNRVFGTIYFDYNTRPTWFNVQYRFWLEHKSALEFWRGMAIAIAAASVMARIGLGWGEWMRRIRR